MDGYFRMEGIGKTMEVVTMVIRGINLILIFDLIFCGKKETESTWAWILLLVQFPIMGLFLYILTGQQIPIRKKKVWEEEKFALTEDNRVEIFTNGEEKFVRLFRDLQSAKKEILIQYYIFQDDFLFEKMKCILCEKAAEGVKVQVLYDTLGSRKMPKSKWKEMKERGILVRPWKSGMWNRLLSRISGVNYRNHRKIVVIDDNIGYVGGINVGKEYLGLEPKFGFWRDTHFRIEGSGVANLSIIFRRDLGEKNPEEEGKKSSFVKGMGSSVQMVASGPDSKEPHIRNVYLRCIGNARESIKIQTPYFVPDVVTMHALKLALLSGKEVKLMIPNKPDHMFVYWATRYYAAQLLALGAKVYLYKEGFLHAKGIIMDEEVYCFGTANMDIRSFFLNREVNVIVYGREEGEKMCEIFEKDIQNCHQLTWEEYASRKLKIRIKEQFSRLLSPLL